jgi:hypothetical protein
MTRTYYSLERHPYDPGEDFANIDVDRSEIKNRPTSQEEEDAHRLNLAVRDWIIHLSEGAIELPMDWALIATVDRVKSQDVAGTVTSRRWEARLTTRGSRGPASIDPITQITFYYWYDSLPDGSVVTDYTGFGSEPLTDEAEEAIYQRVVMEAMRLVAMGSDAASSLRDQWSRV